MKRICSGILCLMLMLSPAVCGGPSYAPLTEAPERPEGQGGPMHGDFEGDQPAQEATEKFVIAEGSNTFSGVTMTE